jgi:sentrin-specific protease 1
MAKLLAVGHASNKGMYDYSRAKMWFKNVNIFEMDKMFMPINHGHLHWIYGVLCMMEEKICMYNSMGSHGMEYFEALLHFIKDKHMSKRGVPLHDIGEWELVGHISHLRSDNGKQNAACTFTSDSMYDLPTLVCYYHVGIDCGVSTCTFADFLSIDLPIVFSQEHINQCRNLIVLSIFCVSTLT